MSALAHDLTETNGYLVADKHGRVIGRVECPMYGTQPDIPDALSVRGGFLSRRRRMVPAETADSPSGTPEWSRSADSVHEQPRGEMTDIPPSRPNIFPTIAAP